MLYREFDNATSRQPLARSSRLPKPLKLLITKNAISCFFHTWRLDAGAWIRIDYFLCDAPPKEVAHGTEQSIGLNSRTVRPAFEGPFALFGLLFDQPLHVMLADRTN